MQRLGSCHDSLIPQQFLEGPQGGPQGQILDHIPTMPAMLGKLFPNEMVPLMDDVS